MSLVLNLCIVFYLVLCVYAYERGDLEKYGPFKYALNSGMIKCVQNKELDLDVSGIKVHFFDFSKKMNATFEVGSAAAGILSIGAGVGAGEVHKKWVMFVGGFTSHIHHSIEQQVIAAYSAQPDTYLVIPDHSQYTHDHDGSIRSYERSVLHIHYIGKALGHMWAELSAGGVSAANIHLVGHSLGGQILGHVGTAFHSRAGRKIARVSALDPAGPCFTKSELEYQVRAGVADYVEVYHSNAGSLGSSSVLADVDYFINNGEVQPHCNMPMIPGIIFSSKAASCNHRAVIDVWTASIKNPDLFQAHSCDSYKSFKNGECDAERTIAGAFSDGTTEGVYYFSTKDYDLNALR